jgi:type VI secretion system FHA domain protein
MPLKMTILSSQREPLGSRGSIAFGVAGGTIGRGRDNDWVLPDPQRYLSAHHARVQFRHGAYYLFDTSTNGVFVNDGTVPLGRRNDYPLRSGDRLRLGDYDIVVSIDGEGGEAPEASEIFPLRPEAMAGSPDVSSGDIGAELSVLDLLRPDPATSSRTAALDAFGQPKLTEDTGLLAYDQSGPRATLTRTRTPPPARREPRAATPSTPASAGSSGFELLCRGAGIDATVVPVEAQSRVLQLIGVLLREAMVGLKGLSVAQRALRDDAGIEVGRDNPQQIALSGLPVEDLLQRLLRGHEQRELDAVQWLRDTLERARRHDLAVMRALHAALAEFVSRLDPRSLAQTAERPAPGTQQADASGLTERFRTITDMGNAKLPHLFAEAFARVFAGEFKGDGEA